MTKLLEFAWLIPALPLGGSVFVGILLFSFNRTMNRLTKPVSWLLIFCVSLSTLYSFFALRNHISGVIFSTDLILENIGYKLGLYIDPESSFLSLVSGVIELIVMISSYILLDRKQGYVRYLIFIGIFSCIIFSVFLSGDFFHDLFDPVLKSLNKLPLPIA